MATNQEQLVNRIKSQLKKIDRNTVQIIMEGRRKKLRKIEDIPFCEPCAIVFVIKILENKNRT